MDLPISLPNDLPLSARSAERALATAWTPLSLGSKLLAWWDASFGISLSGNQVTAWADRKSGYSAVQTTSAKRPVYSETAFGGAPGVNFDGIDDFLLLAPLPLVFPIGNDGSELWSVAQQNKLSANTTTGRIASYGGDSFSLSRYIRRSVSVGVSRAGSDYGDGTGSVRATDFNVVFEGRHLIRGVFDSVRTGVAVNAAIVGGFSSATTPATGNSRFVIGSGNSNATAPGDYWEGPLRDLLVTSPLTDDEARRLAAFLLPRRVI